MRPGGAPALEAHVEVGDQLELHLAVLGPAERLVVAGPGVLPRAVARPVLEAGLAVERHLELAVHAAHQAEEHVVGVVVGGGPAMGVGALVLVVPGPDQKHVAHDNPAAAGAPAGLQHVGAGQVAPGRGHLDVGGAEAKDAGVAVEDRAEHAGRVEA